MLTTTHIRLKCQCPIPFQQELTDNIQVIVNSEKPCKPTKKFLAIKETIIEALASKMLSVNIAFTRPVKKIKPLMIKGLQSLLKKDVVAIIKEGDDDFTLFLH